MTEPAIILSETDGGAHNRSLAVAASRLLKGRGYADLSTIIIVPTRGMVPARSVENWMGLMTPMNQKAIRLFVQGMEVGDAYQQAIDFILAHPELSTWKYVLTLEEDNLPPPDGLLKLYESMGKYAAVGGLYWTKGEGGMPMIYGDPKGILGFAPQVPGLDVVQECNGLGMGFTLFELDVFRNEKLTKPWFKTIQEWSQGIGAKAYTQDLFFFEKLRRAGYRVACDTRVKVGHLDTSTGIVW